MITMFLFPVISMAQSPVDSLDRDGMRSYRSIRSHIRQAPNTNDIDVLSDYLRKGMKTDLEKARSIYLWIAENITYDMKAFMKGRYEDQTVPKVLKEKTAVCEGYANLFSALCSRAGLENAKIVGYSKGYGYEAGQKFAISNHAWNAIKLNDEWYLLDVTWAASRSNSNDFNPAPDNIERYFLTEPHKFLIDHLPEDPQWQLIRTPISLDDFEAGKDVPPGQKKKNVEIRSDVYSKEVDHYERVVRYNPKSGEARFRLGYAYLSKALDRLETIQSLGSDSIFLKLNTLEPEVHELLDKAAENFMLLKPGYSNYDKAVTLFEECEYQKGVFHYEAGYRILSLLVDMDKETYFQNADTFSQEVNSHWDLAINYFRQVPESSLYHEQALRYIDYYIPEFRP